MPSPALAEEAPKEQDRVSDGEHLWVVVAAFRIDPASDPGWPLPVYSANLVKVKGAECLLCEQDYSPAIAALPCPGEPRV